MGLISKIANSRFGRAGAATLGIGTVFVPAYEMLNPVAIYAENSQYDKLVKQIKDKNKTTPLKIKNKCGGIDTTLTGYMASGYNPELKSFVDFIFYPVGSGMLVSKIRESAFVENDMGVGDWLSFYNSLVIIDGGESGIDGKPDAVGIEKTTHITPTSDPSVKIPHSVEIENKEFDMYKTDLRVRRGIDMEYLIALSKTILGE